MGSIDDNPVVVEATSTNEYGYDRDSDMKKFDESKVGVKGLVEGGAKTIPKFFIHPPETLADIKAPTKPLNIPVIDFSTIGTPQGRAKLVQEVKDASINWGFFEVINHVMDDSVMDNVLESIRDFHNQPVEEKAKLYWRSDEPTGVKYSTNNDLYRAKAASWRDSLQVWGYSEPMPFDHIPDICREQVTAFVTGTNQVAETIMELLSEGLGLEPTKFKDLTFTGSQLFVGHCYPPCPQPDLTLGISSHTDPGILTILMPNHVPGLQVKHKGDWVNVKPLHGGLIVNIGDFLQVVSNDVYKSVHHRVLANASDELRLSVVMFYNVFKWKGEGFGYYGVLPELVTPENPAKYRDFTKQEFKANFFGKSLGYKNLVDAVKIENP